MSGKWQVVVMGADGPIVHLAARMTKPWVRTLLAWMKP
jgi:hypothetical protein